MKTTRSLTIVAKTDCQLDTKTAVGGAMSKYRVSFLVWWTTIVLFIAIFIWLNRDLLPTPAYDLTFFAGWAVMIFALGSWIPGAFLRLLRPDQSRSPPLRHARERPNGVGVTAGDPSVPRTFCITVTA